MNKHILIAALAALAFPSIASATPEPTPATAPDAHHQGDHKGMKHSEMKHGDMKQSDTTHGGMDCKDMKCCDMMKSAHKGAATADAHAGHDMAPSAKH